MTPTIYTIIAIGFAIAISIRYDDQRWWESILLGLFWPLTLVVIVVGKLLPSEK